MTAREPPAGCWVFSPWRTQEQDRPGANRGCGCEDWARELRVGGLKAAAEGPSCQSDVLFTFPDAKGTSVLTLMDTLPSLDWKGARIGTLGLLLCFCIQTDSTLASAP